MPKKFRNRYRIDSSRLRGFDYTRDGAYFITICTKNHECLFGEIVGMVGDNNVVFDNVETGLRPVSTNSHDGTNPNNGSPTDATHTNDGLKPDGSTPGATHTNDGSPPHGTNSNHVTNTNNNTNIIHKTNLKIRLSDYGKIVSDCWFDLPNHYSNIILDEFVIMPNHVHGIIIIQNNADRPKQHGLSEFMRAFKSFSTRRINEICTTGKVEIWQPRFYDHIIRSEHDRNRIRKYIRNNPAKWIKR